jgi:hypothetical protein
VRAGNIATGTTTTDFADFIPRPEMMAEHAASKVTQGALE